MEDSKSLSLEMTLNELNAMRFEIHSLADRDLCLRMFNQLNVFIFDLEYGTR